jgi:hypothetical protein
MPRITIIGEGGKETASILSKSFSVIVDDGEDFDPHVTQTVEYDHTSKESQITTDCGETENRRESDDKPDITASGILGKSQLESIKQLRKGDEVTVVSDIHNGPVYVRRTTITQESDLVSILTDSGEEELAFKFQLQLKQPQ